LRGVFLKKTTRCKPIQTSQELENRCKCCILSRYIETTSQTLESHYPLKNQCRRRNSTSAPHGADFVVLKIYINQPMIH